MTNITIEKKGVSINNKLIQFPLSIDSLSAILNKPKWDKNMARYIWNELGIFVRAADKKNVELIAIHFKAGQEPDDPKLPFDGEITVEGQNINKVDFPKGQFFDKQIGSIEIFGVREGKKIVEITIIPSEADSLAEPLENQIDPDKYVIKKTKGAKIKFYDFNFKLAVIQVLMYEKEVLLPKFNLPEFASLYNDREIDLNSEGDQMIPEVKKYFSDVEIDIELADQVTEINQGYTEIYGKLIPDWDGEDDAFNIKSAKGIKQFKNLKSVTLFFDYDKSILDEFKKEGINATWV